MAKLDKLMGRRVLHLLGIIMLVKFIAVVYYVIMTKQFGTPFKDSLTKEQLELKKREADKRAKVYLQGFGIGSVIVFFLLS